eukprot:s4736_g5.t1
MTDAPVPGETAPLAVHDSFRAGLREEDAARHGAASSTRRRPGPSFAPARPVNVPTKAQQALQLQMRQMELKQLALQVKLKRRQEERAKEVDRVLAAKQHQLERERQHAFLEDSTESGGAISPREQFQDSPVESAEELVEDSDGSSPRRLVIRVQDARAIERGSLGEMREKVAYKALMAEQAALREAAKQEQAARRIQAFRRASQVQREKAHAASERLQRAHREQGAQHGRSAPASRSTSPQSRRDEAKQAKGRAASESPRRGSQARNPSSQNSRSPQRQHSGLERGFSPPGFLLPDPPSPLNLREGHSAAHEQEAQHGVFHATPSMEVTFAAPKMPGPAGAAPSSRLELPLHGASRKPRARHDFVQNPTFCQAAKGRGLPSAEEAERMLESPLMGVYHPEMPVQEAKAFLFWARPSHAGMSNSGGASTARAVATRQVRRNWHGLVGGLCWSRSASTNALLSGLGRLQSQWSGGLRRWQGSEMRMADEPSDRLGMLILWACPLCQAAMHMIAGARRHQLERTLHIGWACFSVEISHHRLRTPAFGTSDPVIPSQKIIQKYSDYFVSSPSNKNGRRAGRPDTSPKSKQKSKVVYPRSREVHAWQAAGFEAASVYKGLRNAAGLREGWGVLNQNDGSTYAGQWVSGKRHGVGTLVFDSGIFEGQWVRGEASGSGLVRFTNGDKFEGQYSGNRKHGFGTYAWADGAVEEGQYFNGQKTDWHTWRQGPSQWKLRYESGAVVEAQQANGKKPSRAAGAGVYPRAKEPRLSPFASSDTSKPKLKAKAAPRSKAMASRRQEEDRSGSPAASLMADLQPQEPGRPALNQVSASRLSDTERQQPRVASEASSSGNPARLAFAISKVNSLYRQVALPAEAHEKKGGQQRPEAAEPRGRLAEGGEMLQQSDDLGSISSSSRNDDKDQAKAAKDAGRCDEAIELLRAALAGRGAQVEVAKYELALLLSQLGRHEEADDWLRQLGLTWKLCPSVLDGSCLKGPTCRGEANLVAAFDDVLPSELLHKYPTPSFFSYNEPLMPDCAAETGAPLIRAVASRVKSLAVASFPSIFGTEGCHRQEWWAHTRPAGSGSGHQLHYDLDEVSLEGGIPSAPPSGVL